MLGAEYQGLAMRSMWRSESTPLPHPHPQPQPLEEKGLVARGAQGQIFGLGPAQDEEEEEG